MCRLYCASTGMWIQCSRPIQKTLANIGPCDKLTNMLRVEGLSFVWDPNALKWF